jgi:uncharacterized DUF497 family protein
MKFIFDSAKDAVNAAKHGVSLALASEIEWNSALTWPDIRRVYDEARMCGIGYVGTRMYCVVYVDRGNQRRIISLRKANTREVKRYAEA